MYVNSYSWKTNAASVPALQATVTNLNRGAKFGDTYTFKTANSFTAAILYQRDNPSVSVALVSHHVYQPILNGAGVEVGQRWSGNLAQFDVVAGTGDQVVPASEVDSYFVLSFYCGKNGGPEITNNDIGHALAGENLGDYTNTTTSSKLDADDWDWASRIMHGDQWSATMEELVASEEFLEALQDPNKMMLYRIKQSILWELSNGNFERAEDYAAQYRIMAFELMAEAGFQQILNQYTI